MNISWGLAMLFGADQLDNIRAGRLDSFSEAHRYYRDDKGNTLLHLLIQAKRPLPEIQAVVARLKLPIHVFNDAYKTPIELSLAEGNDDLSEYLLNQAICVDQTYLDAVLGIAFAAHMSPSADREGQIGFFASALTGVDIHQNLNNVGGVRQKYQAHLLSVAGKSDGGTDLEGFWPDKLLALRTRSMLSLFLQVYSGGVEDRDLPVLDGVDRAGLSKEALERSYAQDRLELASVIIAEIKRDIETRLVIVYGDEIAKKADVIRIRLLDAMSRGIGAALLGLKLGQSWIMEVGWEGHSLYLLVTKKGENAWQFLLQNLGEGCVIHEASEGTKRKPYPLGIVTASAISAGVVHHYLQEVLRGRFPKRPYDKARLSVYDIADAVQSRVKILQGDTVSAIASATLPALSAQRIGNCSAENHMAAQFCAMAKPIFEWLSIYERRLVCTFADTGRYPALKRPLPLVLAPLPATPLGRKAWVLRPVEEYKKELQRLYQESCANISGLWAEDPPLSMEGFYLQLNLMTRTLVKKEKPAHGGAGADVEEKVEYEERKAPIMLDALLTQKGHRLVVGDAGYGKSTLFRSIAYRWASAGIAGYEQLILIRLKDLASSLEMLEGDTAGDKLTWFLHFYLFGEKLNKSDLKEAASAFLNDGRILVLLDGYDEIAASATDELLKEILALLRRKENVIISSRPAYIHELGFEGAYTHIEGFSEAQREEEITKFLGARGGGGAAAGVARLRRSKELTSLLRSHTAIWELIRSPMMLKLACVSFIEKGDIKTMTELYQAFEGICQKRHQENFPMLPHRLLSEMSAAERIEFDRQQNTHWEIVSHALAELALDTLDHGKVTLSGPLLAAKRDDLVRRHPGRKTLTQELIRSDYLQAIGDIKKDGSEFARDREFLHLSLLEYFAAKRVVQLLITLPPMEFRLWFARRKLEGRFQLTWQFVSGMITDADLADRWFRCLADFPLENEFGRLGVCLKESKQGLRVADVLVSPLLLSLSNPNWEIKEFAILTLGQLGQATPKVVADLIEILKHDSQWEVRRSAVQTLQELDQATPEVVAALIEALNDCEKYVQYRAAAALQHFGETMPEVITALQEVLDRRGYNHAKCRSLDALGNLRQVTPKMIAAVHYQANWLVRQSAVHALLAQGSAATPEVISALLVALEDPIGGVRTSAAKALGALGKTATPEVIAALNKALHDPSQHVCQAAREALENLSPTWYLKVAATRTVRRDTDDDSHARFFIASILDKPTQVVTALITALRDSSDKVRAAAEALKHLDSTPAEDIKQAFLDSYIRPSRTNVVRRIKGFYSKRASKAKITERVVRKIMAFYFQGFVIEGFCIPFSLFDYLSPEVYEVFKEYCPMLQVREALLGVPNPEEYKAFEEAIVPKKEVKSIPLCTVEGYCEEHGIPRIPIAGDGNCFFSAVVHGMGDRLTSASLREQAVIHFIEHPALHVGMGRGSELGSIGEYSLRMSKDQVWAVGPILDATAQYLGVTLVIMNLLPSATGLQQSILRVNEGAAKQILLLRRDDNHYEPKFS